MTSPPTASSTHPDNASAPASEARSDSRVMRDSGSMAIATLISRITGFLKMVLLGATLGPAIASAFNSANTLPNLITEVVLGAVLTALVVPVLVRAEKEDPDKGANFVRRLLTLSLTILGVVTVLAIVAAPLLVRMSLQSDGKVDVFLGTQFAYLLLPQILFYGVFALLAAVLNTKGIFKPGAWAPVWNNVVSLAVLIMYWLLPGRLHPHGNPSILDPHVLLLGLGTTLGVVVQALILLPALRRAGIDLRPLWGLDNRLKQFGGMAAAIVVYVIISQAGYLITNRIASGADEAGPIIYQQAWLLLQVPYGIVGVTLLTAIMPRLSRAAADRDDDGVVQDLTLATKLTLMALIPIIAFFTAFGTPIAVALFSYGAYPQHTAELLGLTLSFSAFTLVPYSLVLLHLRVFYAREQAWTPTFIILGVTTTKIILSYLAPLLASDLQHVVVLLAAANGFGFVTGAVIGALLLRRSLGSLRIREVLHSATWVTGASIVGALVALGVDWIIPFGPLVGGLGQIGWLLRVAVGGIILIVVCGLILSRSGLREVATVGGLLAAAGRRIPVLRNYLPAPQPTPTAPAAATAAYPQGPDMRGDVAADFGGLPALPPMIASTGTRFVPGATVAAGRFRLLRLHGQADGMWCWRAQQVSTGDHVALTILPATRDPQTGESTLARAEALVGHRLPGVAPIREVLKAGTSVVVVANWTPGLPLREMIGTPQRSHAIATCVTPLVDAIVAAEPRELILGVDSPDRIRIGKNGRAVLAFPGAPLTQTAAADLQGVGRVLYSLVGGRWVRPGDTVTPPHIDQPAIPAELSLIATHAASGDGAIATPQTFARLLAPTTTPRAQTGAVPKISSDTSQVVVLDTATARADRRYSGGKIAALVGIVMAAVITLALIGAMVMGAFGANRPNTPLSPDSFSQGAQQAHPEDSEEEQPPVAAEILTVADAVAFQLPGDNGTADNPERAALAIDGDPATGWSTATYVDNFGLQPPAYKQGLGLLLTLQQAALLSEVEITSTAAGTVVEIRSAPSATPADLEATELLGTATLTAGTTAIELAETAEPTDYVLVWITSLAPGNSSELAEVTIAGVVD